MTTYNTLLLDQTAWDLVIDSAGNIAMAAPPYALAQDVASAVRLFLGELWYNTPKGIPYFENVLGHLPPLSLLTGYIENAALTVPGVVSAQCVISQFSSRAITGQIQFIDETGAARGVTF
jgi:hypothetical protein